MSWTSLSDIIQRLRPHIPSVASGEMDLRSRAALLVVTAFPAQSMQMPELLNIAALALSMPRLTVHRLTADAAAQVRATELAAIPNEPPRLLRGAWLVESRRPERHALFGSTVCLGGYTLNGLMYLVGLEYPDGIRVDSVAPDWSERDLDTEVAPSPFVEDLGAHRAWVEQAAEWIITLGALLDAEGTPVEAAEWPQKRNRKQGASTAPQDDWIVRRVALSEEGRTRVTSRTQEPADTPAPRENLEPVETWVRGYLRRQPYGPGRSQRKWVYITEHQARRWVSTRPVRVDVDV